MGVDSSDLLEVPLLSNRVDRFIWGGQNLTFDRNLIMLRVFQNDGAPTPPNQGDQDQPPAGTMMLASCDLAEMANCMSWWVM